jgi:hypothetical protein
MNIGCKKLCQIHVNQSDGKGVNKPFGGIHTILMGDPFQYGPIKDAPLWKKTRAENYETFKSSFNSKVGQKEISTTYGRYIWLQMTHCVILTQPMRQIDDLYYASLVERVKYGNATNMDYQNLQSRIYNNSHDTKFNIDNTKIVYSRNNIRAITNQTMAKHFAKIRNKCIIAVYSIDNWINKTISENRDKIITYHLSLLDESKTEKLCFKLSLIVGCKYLITQNYCSEIGLSNNTEVILEKILTIENSTEKNFPICLLVSKVTKSERDDSNLFKNLNKPFFPIFKRKAYFQLKLSDLGVQINITRLQFPLMLAFSVTSNNQQGATISKGLIDLTKPITGTLQQAMATVTLGRFRKLIDLTIIDNFDIDILQQKPHLELLAEENRYKELANSTLKNYYATSNEFLNLNNGLNLEQYIISKHGAFHKINETEQITNYFLKFGNINNDCYSNSIIQFILAIGPELDNKFQTNQQCQIYTYFKKLRENLLNKNEHLHSSELLRTIIYKKMIETKMQLNSENNLIDGNQHDANEFLRYIFLFMDSSIVRLFSFESIYQIECICGKKNIIATLNEQIFDLKTEREQINFKEYFNSSFVQACCISCKNELQIQRIYINVNKFLILRIERGEYGGGTIKRRKILITDFNEELVFIPHSNSQFKLKAFISHYPNDESNESLGGHYATSVKIGANCWQEISDSECSYRKYLPKYLENVYMLLLEKL